MHFNQRNHGVLSYLRYSSQLEKMPITFLDDSQLPCKKADPDIKNGTTAYHDYARTIFPILVKHAKNGFFPYTELTAEIGLGPYFDLTWPFAIIGRAIEEYNKVSNANVPRITFMIVKKSDFSSPLVGTKCFILEGEKVITEGILKKEINKIINYDKWNEVLRHFGLETINPFSNQVL